MLLELPLHMGRESCHSRPILLCVQILICQVAYLPKDVNIIRDVKDSRNTACGHNDFCSVRLNGPIWWFILTHRYRLSLSQFTEAVTIESATGATFAAQKQESPDAKVSCPSGCCRIILPLLYSIATAEIVPTKTHSRS